MDGRGERGKVSVLECIYSTSVLLVKEPARIAYDLVTHCCDSAGIMILKAFPVGSQLSLIELFSSNDLAEVRIAYSKNFND
jgi:hypothetical protein